MNYFILTERFNSFYLSFSYSQTHTLLYFTSPNFTLLYFTSPNFTLLYFTSPNFTSLYFTSLSGSSTAHLMPLLISITRLFFHSAKPEKVVKPYMGIIFLEYLKDYFGLKRGIEAEDDVKSLCDISNHLVSVRRRFIDKEHVIQGFGYLLLTIYSSDQLNCDILEDNFHFLSLLLASLPALDGWDSISAVLTTLNYVCQCIDSETEMPIVALCAAMTVMSRTALYGDTSAVRDRALQQLDATCSSFEAIVRGQPQYAQIILKSGMLKWVLCDTLRGVLHVQMLPLYLRVVDFVTSVIKKGPPDVMTVQQSGLLPLFYSILSPDNNSNNDNNNNNNFSNNNYDSNKGNNHYSDPPKELMEQLLKLLEELVKAEPLHLEEIFKGIIRLLDVLIISRISQGQGLRSLNKSAEKKNNEKIILLCNSLGRILKGEKEALIVWRELNGFQWLIVYIGRLEGSFLSLPGLPEIGNFTAFSTAKLSASPSSSSSSSSSSPLLDSSSRRNMSSSGSSSSGRDRDRDNEITHPSCVTTDDPAGVVSVINALMSCIAIDMLVSSPYHYDKKAKDFELYRAGVRYNNAHLTDALLSTNIFSSAYAEYGLHALFGLVTGRVDQITNDTAFSITTTDGSSARPVTSSSVSATSFSASFSTSSSSSSSSSSSKIASNFNPNSSFSSSSMLSYVYSSKSSKGSIMVPQAAEIIADMLLWLPSSIGLRAIQILNELSVCSQDGKYGNMYLCMNVCMYVPYVIFCVFYALINETIRVILLYITILIHFMINLNGDTSLTIIL